MTARLVDMDALRAALNNPETNIDRHINGYTPLHIAISRHQFDAVVALVAAGADIDKPDYQGYTPYDYCCRYSFAQAEAYLKEAGAEAALYGAYYGQPLYGEEVLETHHPNVQQLFALSHHNQDRLRQALDNGADPNSRVYNAQRLILHMAMIDCNVDAVRLLLAAGANPAAPMPDGCPMCEVMWRSAARHYFTPRWHETYDLVEERGGMGLFAKNPKDWGVAELRLSNHTYGKNFLSLLCEAGRLDIVRDIARRDTAGFLNADDFLKDNGKILRGIYREGLLPQLFTTDIWQGRLEEMMRVYNACTPQMQKYGKVDIQAACAAVVCYRQNKMAEKARQKGFRLP